MADNISLSALRKTYLSSTIATQAWTEEKFMPLSAQVRQAWYGECDTAQSTKAKTVEIPGITELQTGLQVRIKFTTAQRASSPTLDVNDLGAYPIRRNETTAVANYEWLAGEVIDLVFDGTAWIVSDGGVATTSYYGYTKLYSGATSTSTAYSLVPASLNSFSEKMVVGAPALLTTSTYSVGDRVRYQFNTYECISDVQTPGAWASISSHFKELDPIQIQIDNLSDAVANIDVPEIEGKFVHLSGDKVSSDFCLKAPDGNNALSGIAKSGPIAIGYGSAAGTNATAIGAAAEANGHQSVACGVNSSAGGSTAIAIGVLAGASATRSIAIGNATKATAENAIQLGNYSGSDLTNSTANTFQVWDKPLLERTGGKIFFDRIPTGTTSATVAVGNHTHSQYLTSSDISDYALKTTVSQLSNEVVDGLSNVVVPKLDTISVLVKDETEKLDDLSGQLSNYSLTSHTHSQYALTSQIPTVNNGTLYIKKNGENVATFTANQSGNVTANIQIPLSDYTLKTTTNAFSAEVIDGLSNNILPTLSTVANLVEEETAKIDELSNNLSNYSLTSHGHNASAISAGTLNIARIPTGTTGTTVAYGNHTHSEYSLTGHTHQLSDNVSADVKNVFIETTSPTPGEFLGIVGNAYAKSPTYVSDGQYAYAYSCLDLTAYGGYSSAELNSELYSKVSNYDGTYIDKIYGYGVVDNGSYPIQLGNVHGTYPSAGQTTVYAYYDSQYVEWRDSNQTAYDGTMYTELSPKLVMLDNGTKVWRKARFYSYYGQPVSFVSFVLLFDYAATTISGLSSELQRIENKISQMDGAYVHLSGDEIPNTFCLKFPNGNNFLSTGYYGAGTSLGCGSSSNGGGLAIGHYCSAEIENATAIGHCAAAEAEDSLAVGSDAVAKYDDSVALGVYSSANALSAIQLGRGLNSTKQSFQVWDYPLLLSSGTIPYARISNDVSLSTVEQSFTLTLTEDQKTALVQQSGIPAEAWGDFAITLNTAQGYGYVGNIDCYNIAQNVNGDWVFTGGMPVLESALGWVSNVTILQGSKIFNVLSVGNTSVDIALKSDIEGYLPLNGGGVVIGNIVIESIDGYNLFSLGSYGKVEIGKGTYANNNGAIAIGSDTSADNGTNIAIGYSAYAKKSSSIAIGPDAEVSGDFSIQLGPPGLNGVQRTVLSTDNTFRVWHYPMLDGNGDIPYGRLSASGVEQILPISSVSTSTIALTKNTYVYRVTDSSGTGTFPTLTAPTGIVASGGYYFTFEIEWTTTASLASYAVQYDWINYPEMLTDGQSHTYYITGRWDSAGSGAGAFTLNCWRRK